jgi:hypothetical protein
MFPERIHRVVFLIGTALLVIGLPVSYFLLSVSIILLSLNWVLEARFKRKWEIIRHRKAILLILSIYFIHLIWFFNSSDLAYAIHDIRIKLPLLALPLIYGTAQPLSKKEFKIILQLFIGTVLVNSLITTFILLGFTKLDPIDPRKASLFLSHIRFALMVVLSIYVLFYLLFFNEFSLTRFEKYSGMVWLAWLICFLVILQSFTGIVVFLILCPVAIVWLAHYRKKHSGIISAYLSCTIILIAVAGYIILSINRYSRVNEPENTILESHTVNGAPYLHAENRDEYENGYKIWNYISIDELKKEWNKRSDFNFDSLDRKGQLLKITLIRYMTSMGLRKDSMGISQLDPEDIHMVEKGYTNHIYRHKFAIYPRIYVLLWEIDQYRKTGDPSGQSLGQRIEYLKVGINIIKRHFWLGTGTGDVQQEFYKQYELDKSLLKPEWRRKTHNQLITFFIAFGVFGFLWILFALIAPAFYEKKYNDYLFMLFFLLSILSMLNEDTLETHPGVSLFAFFYSFFLFVAPVNKSPKA